MNHLPEILRLVAQLRDPKLEVIDESRDADSSESIKVLYEGFKSGRFPSDMAAAEAIYGTSQLDSKYTTLKSRLKRRLLNSLFLLDLKRKQYSLYTQTTYACNKRLFMVKTLLTLGARSSAIRIAETTLSIAQSFELTGVEAELYLLLRTHASLLGDSKLYGDRDAGLKSAMSRLEAEAVSWEYYERIALEFGTSEEVKLELVEKAKAYLEALEKYRNANSTFTFMWNYFRVKYFYFEYAQDVPEMLNTCMEALQHLAANPKFSFSIRVGEFTLKQLHCYLLLRDFENGFDSVQRCSQLFPRGTDPWFVYHEYHLLLSLHTQHFIEADRIYREVVSEPRFESQSETRKEKWKIFELYVKYALVSSSTKEMLVLDQRPQLRIKTFLRSVPTYTRDKRGLNVSILVLQILYLLESEDFDGIINRMEALRTYRTRYLRTNSNRKSGIFFKMLQIMESNSFSFRLTKEKSKKYFDRLVEMRSDAADTSEGLQVLPFDWLWLHVLDRLKEIEDRHSLPKAA